MDDVAVYADGGEGADQRTISVEVDAFYDGFRLRNTTDNVPSERCEQIRAVQRLYTTGCAADRRLRYSAINGGHRNAGETNPRTCEECAANYGFY